MAFVEQVMISSTGGTIANVRKLGVQVVTGDTGLIVNSVIHGLNSLGGNTYVDVKVNPSGALSVSADLNAGTNKVQVTGGTIVVTQPTAANLNATVVGTGTFATQSSFVAGSNKVNVTGGTINTITNAVTVNTHAVTQSGTWGVSLLGTGNKVQVTGGTIGFQAGSNKVNVTGGTITANLVAGTNKISVTGGTITNLQQLGGAAISMNTGVRDAGTQRVTIATNDVVPTSQSGTWTVGLLAGSNKVNVTGGTIGFQAGSNKVNVTGGTVNSKLQDGAGNLITSATRGSERALSVQLVDGSGTQVTSFGGGTEYTEDAAAAANPLGKANILVRQDTPATLVSNDGDNVAQRGTNYGAAYVQLVNSSGSFIDSVGGGSTKIGVTGGTIAISSVDTTTSFSDAGSNTQNSLLVENYNNLYNGSTWDRARTIEASTIINSGATTLTGVAAVGIGPGFSRQVNPSNLGTAANSASIFNVNGSNTIRVSINTSTTGTFTFEASNDGINWTSPEVYDTATDSRVTATNLTPTAAKSYVVNSGSYRMVRLRTVTTLGATMAHFITGSLVNWLYPFMGGDIAHDSADSNNPVKIGMKAATGLTAVQNADRANAISDLYGRQLVSHIDPLRQVWKSANYTTTQTGAAMWTPTSTRKVVLTYLAVSSYATTGARVIIWFGASADTTYTAGTDQLVWAGSFAPSTTSKPAMVLPLPNPIYAATADHVLRITTDAGISLDITMYGYEI